MQHELSSPIPNIGGSPKLTRVQSKHRAGVRSTRAQRNAWLVLEYMRASLSPPQIPSPLLPDSPLFRYPHDYSRNTDVRFDSQERRRMGSTLAHVYSFTPTPYPRTLSGCHPQILSPVRLHLLYSRNNEAFNSTGEKGNKKCTRTWMPPCLHHPIPLFLHSVSPSSRYPYKEIPKTGRRFRYNRSKTERETHKGRPTSSPLLITPQVSLLFRFVKIPRNALHVQAEPFA